MDHKPLGPVLTAKTVRMCRTFAFRDFIFDEIYVLNVPGSRKRSSIVAALSRALVINQDQDLMLQEETDVFVCHIVSTIIPDTNKDWKRSVCIRKRIVTLRSSGPNKM